MTDNNNQQPNPEEISEITNESNEDVELNEAENGFNQFSMHQDFQSGEQTKL